MDILAITYERKNESKKEIMVSAKGVATCGVIYQNER